LQKGGYVLKLYESLFRQYYNQPNKIVFSFFKDYNNKKEHWEEPFRRLSDLAKKEEWNFKSDKYKKDNQNFPILSSYLNYTFLRLQEQNKIVYSEDENKACINTGLQTKDEKDIYITFVRNKLSDKLDQPDWTLFSFADSYSNNLKFFRDLPEIATYIEDANDLVFDLDYDIEINIAHIVDLNIDRLPDTLKQNRTLAMAAIEGSTNFLKDKIQRNYKVAIPHWYKGSIQLLLPLNITDNSEADLALVADKDKDRRIYRIKTALSMDMAYIDARLICRPDRDWLNP
jgi:hypothetical protein